MDLPKAFGAIGREFWLLSWTYRALIVKISFDEMGSLTQNHVCRHQNYNSEVNDKRIVAIWSNLAAILATILDLQPI